MEYLFAHSEDLHTETTSDLVHNLTQTEVALPLYILANIAIYYGLRNWKGGRHTLLIYMLFNLVVGFGLFTAVPIVSAIAISTGIVGALAVSFILIASKG